jgi:hypothetical protein
MYRILPLPIFLRCFQSLSHALHTLFALTQPKLIWRIFEVTGKLEEASPVKLRGTCGVNINAGPG